MPTVPLYHVDAFTREPFRGNPAAVCLLPSWRSPEWMQSLAAEMNLSETVFIVAEGTSFRLRWFTPITEVPLCGHATLASAHVLFETGRAGNTERLEFASASGPLAAVRAGSRIELDFPARRVEQCATPDTLVESLGVLPAFVGRTTEGDGGTEYLCLLHEEREVRAVRPNFAGLRPLGAGVIVTAPGSGRHAIVSRFFAPAYGIDEDPVTGIAHCALAPFWAPRLGSDHFLAWQASARGGEIEVTLRGNRVGLAGSAVIICEGQCRV